MAAVARTEPRRRRTDPTTWTAVRARSADWWLRRGQSPRRLGILAIIPACRDMQRPSKCMMRGATSTVVARTTVLNLEIPGVCNYQWTTGTY